MTGNTALLGLALGQGHPAAAAPPLAAGLGFVLGAALAAAMLHLGFAKLPVRRGVAGLLAAESCLLAGLVLAWQVTDRSAGGLPLYVLILLGAAGMGVQSVAARQDNRPGVTTVVFTAPASIVIAVTAQPTHRLGLRLSRCSRSWPMESAPSRGLLTWHASGDPSCRSPPPCWRSSCTGGSSKTRRLTPPGRPYTHPLQTSPDPGGDPMAHGDILSASGLTAEISGGSPAVRTRSTAAPSPSSRPWRCGGSGQGSLRRTACPRRCRPRRGELVRSARAAGGEGKPRPAGDPECGKILQEGLGEVQEMIDICDLLSACAPALWPHIA
jgi:hypothetical protein